MSDLPNLRRRRARLAAAGPLSPRQWPRIVKPIALGWLLAAAVAATALSQTGGGDPADDLRGRLDEGPERTLADAPAEDTIVDPQAARRTPRGAQFQPSQQDPTHPAVGLPSPAASLPVAPSAPGGPAPGPSGLQRRKSATEDDPFAPLGVRVGAFLLRPAIEVLSGYDSNPARLPGGGRSALLIVAPELELRSDWERHELTAAIRGSYNDYPASALADRPALNAAIDGRIDVTRDSRIDLEARSVLGTDYPGSPNLTGDIAKLPIFTAVGGTFGLGQRFGPLDVALKGMIDRTTWQDSRLTDGALSSNDDRNFNQVGGQLRAAYTLTGALVPFVALDFDTRVHDLALDRSGLLRDSQGLASRAGISFAFAQRLTGELAFGYLARIYQDPTLPDVRGPSVDGSLLFILTPLTSVRLSARSTIDESVLAGVSGLLRRDSQVSLDHALRRWLIATVRVGYGNDDYVGSTREDRRYLASLGLTYKLTRAMSLKGELEQVWLCSSEPGQNYAATVATIGVRYQP